MFRWLKTLFGRALRPINLNIVRAKYDAAQNTDENRRHWANADGLDAVTTNSSDVRVKLRNRSRYEFDNNGYPQGIILTLANDLIGTGPRPRIKTANREAAKRIERRFTLWGKEIGWVEKLHLITKAKKKDGEGFGLFMRNPNLKSSVKLDLVPIEADRFESPNMFDNTGTGGVVVDQFGNPSTYILLDEHPGAMSAFGRGFGSEFSVQPAQSVIHWFRKDRAGQVRGIPELTPGLPLFATLRRYTLATLGSAEIAASFSAFLETQAPAEGADELTPFDTVEIERGMLATLPAGAKLATLKAEQPTTNYEMFKNAILREIGRPLNAPFGIIAGDGSGYNFTSLRFDYMLYRAALRVERFFCEQSVTNRIFETWSAEDKLLNPADYEAVSVDGILEYQWYWPGFEYIQPEVDAKADTERLNNNTTTLQELLAEWGLDWEEVVTQRAEEIDRLRELGITVAEVVNKVAPGANGGNGEEADSSKEAAQAGGVQATALNGAQIASLVLIADKLVLKQISKDAAEALIQASFPLMPRELIKKMVDSLDKFKPKEPPKETTDEQTNANR